MDRAATLNWRTDRHGTYPTTDVALHTVPDLEYALLPVTNWLVTQAANVTGLKLPYLWVREQFLVQYKPGAQAALKKHRDASLASFVVCIDDDFVGGGTAFPWGPVERPKAGDALVFSGMIPHEGKPVTQGRRLILTGFLDYHAPQEEWERIQRVNPTVVQAAGSEWCAKTSASPARPYVMFNVKRLMARSGLRGPAALNDAWPHANLTRLVGALSGMRNIPKEELQVAGGLHFQYTGRWHAACQEPDYARLKEDRWSWVKSELERRKLRFASENRVGAVAWPG